MYWEPWYQYSLVKYNLPEQTNNKTLNNANPTVQSSDGCSVHKKQRRRETSVILQTEKVVNS